MLVWVGGQGVFCGALVQCKSVLVLDIVIDEESECLCHMSCNLPNEVFDFFILCLVMVRGRVVVVVLLGGVVFVLV